MRKTLLLGFVLLEFVGFRLALALGFAFALFLAFGFLFTFGGLGIGFRGRRAVLLRFGAGRRLGRGVGLGCLRERGERERRGNQRNKQFLHSGFLSPKVRSNADLPATTR